MQFEDIHLADAQLYALFRQYFTAGNYTAALNVLAQNSQLDWKGITADNLNELNERVYGMEDVYYTEVEEYLAQLYANLGQYVNNFCAQSQYDSTQQYHLYNFVYYNGQVYFCIQEPPVGTVPTNTTYWLYLGLFGYQGQNSLTNLNFMGSWDSETNYNENDVVYVNNTFYWALQANSNQDPTTTNSEYWGVLFIVPIQQVVVADTNPSITLNTNDFWWQVEQIENQGGN